MTEPVTSELRGPPRLASPAEIREMFEIPKSLLKLLEPPPAMWGPLTPTGADTILSSERVAKALSENPNTNSSRNSFDGEDSISGYELILDGCNLVSLGRPPFPLAALSKLRKLVLSNNRLSYEKGEVAAANTSKKREATTSAMTSSANTANELQSALLNVLPELRELQLDHNTFTAFPPAAHAKLEMLNISGNDIHFLEPCSLPKLEFLDLSGNQHFSLLSMAKSKWNSLVTLDISRCGIDSLQPLAAVVHLRSLSASKNMLTSLTGIESLTSLEFIDASHNLLKHARIATTRGGSENGPNLLGTGNPLSGCAASLQELHLQDNRISTMAFFPSGGMKNLWRLFLAGNPLGGSAAAAAVSETDGKLGDVTGRGKSSDDIGDATYNDDDDETQSGNSASRAANSTKKTSPATTITAKRGSNSSNVKSSTPTIRRVTTVAVSGAPASNQQNPPQQQAQQVTNCGIATKIASMCPNLEVLDLSRTGVVTTKEELDGVCSELSKGCIYLRELELPLPNAQDGNALVAGSDEEAALIDLVVSRMQYLSRFNGYTVRDETKISVADDARKESNRAELNTALDELAELAHIVDPATAQMLREFTIETNAAKAQLQLEAQRRNQQQLQQRPQSARSGTAHAQNDDDDDDGQNLFSARPASASSTRRPGSANGAKSTIPKQRPVLRKSGFSLELDAKAQRERDAAKFEFELMLGEIATSRHSIESALDRVESRVSTWGLQPERKGSPFREVEEAAAKLRQMEQVAQAQRQLQQQNQELQRGAMDKYAARAAPASGVPHPPPPSKAVSASTKLAERILADGARMRQNMAQDEQHVRTTLHPSSVPPILSASASTRANQSPASVPLGQRKSAPRKKAEKVASSSSDDDGDDLAKQVAAVSARQVAQKKNAAKPELQARVSKWSTERKEPLSVRLARIAESYNGASSANDKVNAENTSDAPVAASKTNQAPNLQKSASAPASPARASQPILVNTPNDSSRAEFQQQKPQVQQPQPGLAQRATFNASSLNVRRR